MSEQNDPRLREMEERLRQQKEALDKLLAMDTSDKEACLRAADELEEQIENNQRFIQGVAYEKVDNAVALLERLSAKNPKFAAFIQQAADEANELERQKNEQEGWHEVIE